MKIPTDYLDGYENALQIDKDGASNYVLHTTVGDPLADELIDDMANLDQKQSAEVFRSALSPANEIAAGQELASLKRFREFCNEAPDWLDFDTLNPGCAMFHRNVPLVLAGMVAGVLIEGFSTNISQSFFVSGKLRYQGIKRLRQNNRHMLEIFMPGGLERYNDGWALSIRIRLVHAKKRRLLQVSDEWDEQVLGVPLSAAHVGFASAAFSARLIRHMKTLGASFSDEERKSFMQVWRYSAYLMGVPETILFRDENDALELFSIGQICEPPVSLESIAMAWSLINSAPLLAGATESEDRKKVADQISRVSRTLIGDQLADDLNLPKINTSLTLLEFKFLNAFQKVMSKFNRSKYEKQQNITKILELSHYDEEGIAFKLPDHYYAEESSNW